MISRLPRSTVPSRLTSALPKESLATRTFFPSFHAAPRDLKLIRTRYRSTLKVFRKGESSDYGGARKTDGIVSYMRK